jgi:peptidoglycan/LPS O-acetylase OafA/YrhL
VLGVILFHAGLGLPGGYVGVDVFFVISGFLITQIVATEIDEGRFTLAGFWMRRIRRILPAVGFLVLATLLFGCFILDPRALEGLGRSAVAQAFMLSNVFFWQESGYFAEAAETQPLLHTWSLSVEEQFYVIFPLVLVLIFRYRRRQALAVLVAMAGMSFLLSVLSAHFFRSAGFYLLPTRAWELFVGAILALTIQRFRPSRVAANAGACLGCGMITAAMLLYTRNTPFPGVAAVVPVAGAALLILANGRDTTAVGRILASKVLVLVGLMSYSLYLWHWPILVYLRHIVVDVRLGHVLVALGLVGGLSAVSWKYVEVPFRNAKILRRPAMAFGFGATVTCSVAVFAGMLWFRQGIPSRFSGQTLAMLEDVQWTGASYATEDDVPIDLGRKDSRGNSSAAPDFVLWGDSHGMAVASLLDEVAAVKDLHGVAFLSSGCAPVTGLWKPARPGARELQTRQSRMRMDWIKRSGAKSVLLVGRWNGMTMGMLDTEIDLRIGIGRDWSLVADAPDMVLTPETCRDALQRQLDRMLKEFEASGVRVWALLQIPEAGRSAVARDFYLMHRFPVLNGGDFMWDAARVRYECRSAMSRQVFAALKAPNLVVLDPVGAFLGQDKGLQLYSDRAFYRDEDHLTRPGAEHYLRPLLSATLSEIRSTNGGCRTSEKPKPAAAAPTPCPHA